MTTTEMLLADVRARINPQYKDTVGTESYERQFLIGLIDKYRTALEKIKDMTVCNALGEPYYRCKTIACDALEES